MSNPKQSQSDQHEQGDVSENKPVCGIVMPISSSSEQYTADHWRRVRKIIERSIRVAEMQPQLVWEKAETDIIQAKILQNIYENDVVICDVSSLNPNVMLETGLRLSTKRPTIIITDEVVKPPFDISTFSYIPYQYNLEFNALDEFVGKLAKRIGEVHKAFKDQTYKSFVENYRFETVTPMTVNVTSERFIVDRLEAVSVAIERLSREVSEVTRDSSFEYSASVWPAEDAISPSNNPVLALSLQARLSEKLAHSFRGDIGRTGIATVTNSERDSTDSYTFRVRFRVGESEAKVRSIRKLLIATLRAYEKEYLNNLSGEG